MSTKLLKSCGSAGAVLVLAACGAAVESANEPKAPSTEGRLVLAIESAETAPDGRRCILAVTARNNTGAPSLNVQAAWTAQTEGYGIISDYQFLGEFAAGEGRSLSLGIYGAPCDAVRDLKLTRAVCVVGPAQTPPQSCADKVMLDGGGVVIIRQEPESDPG